VKYPHNWKPLPCILMTAMRETKPFATAAAIFGILSGCSPAQRTKEPSPDVRINLSAHGLPQGFFRADAERCAHEIISYRFVVWLNAETVAVGFSASPSCRVSPERKVDGLARVLVFSVTGDLKAQRDIPYLADGYGEVVAEGEAMPGPGGTLLFRVQSVSLDREGRHESPSGVLLLDEDLRDTARIDRFLMQTTLVDHDLVFLDGRMSGRLGTYVIQSGSQPVETERWDDLELPTGARDRKFGEHGFAFMQCAQELRPNEYSSTDAVHAFAKTRCTMEALDNDRKLWKVPLKDGETAEIIGVLGGGSVIGLVSGPESKGGQLVLWRKQQNAEVLPWAPKNYCASFQSGTADMSRYAAFATCDDRSDHGRWLVFDRKSQKPIANRTFPKSGRAALAPDGMRYASFESGELRIYLLPGN
jgi:hypothetical protein